MNGLNFNWSRAISRRWFLSLMALSACRAASTRRNQPLTVGVVTYEDGGKSIEQYDRFKRYLGEKLQARVDIEPAINETMALERIQSQRWALVFAPPGLTAIALSEHGYKPVLPMFGVENLRSVLVVQNESPIQSISDLSGKAIALGQPGSVTGYYLPLFNLYGLTLSELMFPVTPKAILEAVSQGKAEVGAVSLKDFNNYKSQTVPFNLRVLFTDPHSVPAGSVLISSRLDGNAQDALRQALSEASSVLAQEVEFVTNAPVPDYEYIISVVERVRSIFPGDTRESVALLQQKPVRLFK